MRYFKKFYPNRRFLLSNGGTFMFQTTADPQIGIHATDNPVLIKDFELGIQRKVGGVVEITQAEYEDLKKKEPPPKRHESLTSRQFELTRLADARAAAERAAKPTQFTPLTRKQALEKASRLQNRTFIPKTIDRP